MALLSLSTSDRGTATSSSRMKTSRGMPASVAARNSNSVVAMLRTVTPVVLGRTRDGDDVTLLDVVGTNLTLGQADDAREVYRGEAVLVGVHTNADAFVKAVAEFDWLDAWLDPPSIIPDERDRETVSVRVGRVEHTNVHVGDDILRLASRGEGTTGQSAVHLDRRSVFEVELASALGLKNIVDCRVKPFHDLLTVAMGRSVRLTRLRLRPADADPRDPLCEVRFASVQATPAAVPSLHAVASYSAPTLLIGRDAPLDRLIPAWFDLWEHDRDALALLLAPYYAPFIYSQHRFAAAVQAVEALHNRTRFGSGASRDLARQAHAARVAAIVDAAVGARVDEQTVEWAARILTSRNDKPFWRKIDDVVRSTGAAGEAVIAVAPSFSRTIADARPGVSHGGAAMPLDTAARYWHGEVLQWIARVRLLADAGVDGVDKRACDRTGFQHAVAQVGEAAAPA